MCLSGHSMTLYNKTIQNTQFQTIKFYQYCIKYSTDNRTHLKYSVLLFLSKLTRPVNPGAVTIELSFNLLLTSQLHEGPAVLNSLPLFGKFTKK